MNIQLRSLAVAALALAALTAQADLYTDATGDLAVGTFPHIDIASVDVINTLSEITFTINLAGNPNDPNWGKYNIIMRSPDGGTLDSSANGNGWGRPYSLNGGANRFIGGWTDQFVNNGQVWSFATGSWAQTNTLTSALTVSSVAYTISLADLGLSAGDALVFDVVTTGGGGGDGAVDALSNPNAQIADWGNVSVAAGLTYTVTPVPEPASMIALGLGAAAMLRRRRK